MRVLEGPSPLKRRLSWDWLPLFQTYLFQTWLITVTIVATDNLEPVADVVEVPADSIVLDGEDSLSAIVLVVVVETLKVRIDQLHCLEIFSQAYR